MNKTLKAVIIIVSFLIAAASLKFTISLLTSIVGRNLFCGIGDFSYEYGENMNVIGDCWGISFKEWVIFFGTLLLLSAIYFLIINFIVGKIYDKR